MAAAAAGAAEVEAALKEVDKAAKKQKTCAASSADAVDRLLQVGAGCADLTAWGRVR